MYNYEFNNKILRLAPRFETRDAAPGDFKGLVSNPTLIVWSGASDQTIYGDPKVNHAMRAWHDSLHLRLQADFTLQGEYLVALEQARLIKSDFLGDLIMAEVYGQVEYLYKHGTFPLDQRRFVIEYLKLTGAIF